MPPTADGAPLLKKHTGRNDSSVCIFTVQEKVGALFGSYFFVRVKEDSLKTFDGWFGRRYFDRLIRPKLFTSCYILSSSVKKCDNVAAPLFSSSRGVATQKIVIFYLLWLKMSQQVDSEVEESGIFFLSLNFLPILCF